MARHCRDDRYLTDEDLSIIRLRCPGLTTSLKVPGRKLLPTIGAVFNSFEDLLDRHRSTEYFTPASDSWKDLPADIRHAAIDPTNLV